MQEATLLLKRMQTAIERTREASSGFIGSLDIGFSIGIGNTGMAEKIQAFNEKYPEYCNEICESESIHAAQISEKRRFGSGADADV